ncbi:MAG: hypothetical protein WBF43_09235 [Methylocella sp.]
MAGNKTPRPDTSKQTEQSQTKLTLADGAAHTFKGVEASPCDEASA